MRVLITGINGFVGGHLAEYLLASGRWEVWGLSRSSAIALPELAGKVQLVQADLADAEATMRAIVQVRPHVIFHLAGQPFVPESFRDPAGTLAANTLGALHIFLTLIEYRMATRVLVIGTNEEYGKIDPEDLPIDEDTPYAQPVPTASVKRPRVCWPCNTTIAMGLIWCECDPLPILARAKTSGL